MLGAPHCMENGQCIVDSPIKNCDLVFHSYDKLPEGSWVSPWFNASATGKQWSAASNNSNLFGKCGGIIQFHGPFMLLTPYKIYKISLQFMPATLQLVQFALAQGRGMTGHPWRCHAVVRTWSCVTPSWSKSKVTNHHHNTPWWSSCFHWKTCFACVQKLAKI